MCIKGVVFFTWWQGILIALLQSYGIINERGSWAADDVADGLQDYLICVEMLFFALAHSYTFSYTEYITLNGGDGDEALLANDSYMFMSQALPEAGSFRSALWNSSVPSEITNDIKNEVFKSSRKKKKKTRGGGRLSEEVISFDEGDDGEGEAGGPGGGGNWVEGKGEFTQEVLSI